MEYNTGRKHLVIKEYGRHIQQMVDYLLTIEDRDERQENANTVVELMGFLNPHLKNVEDFRHMLWDHLFLISNFKLDVDSPYPIPTEESLKAKPPGLPYPRRYPRYNHLGKNIELVIKKALGEEDQEKRQGFANSIAYYMKLVYSNWHKELVHDDTIQAELSDITEGQLEFNNRPYVKHKAEIRSDLDDYRIMARNNQRERSLNYAQRNQQQRAAGGGNSRGNSNGNSRSGGPSRGNSGPNRGNSNRGNFSKKRY